MVAALPMIAIAAGIKLTSPGPVLFRQKREGYGGRVFEILKFRTMRMPDRAAEVPSLVLAVRNDPRTFAFGSFLRRTSLDELPQLINVLRGEMSLVGPRPVQEAEIDRYYGASAAHYMAVRPGITGLWQVSGRSETSYESRVALDVAYVSRPSLLADLSILLRTPVAVVSRRGAH
jgi:lipopolysaccharide/colanic/teichoic acid biosynthesis glycosyltransferase